MKKKSGGKKKREEEEGGGGGKKSSVERVPGKNEGETGGKVGLFGSVVEQESSRVTSVSTLVRDCRC